MSFKNSLTTALASGKGLGFWLTFPSAPLAKTILRTAATTPAAGGSFSWVLVDAEHGLITDRDYYGLVTAIAAEGASPIIRVPWAEEWLIKRALDAGAHGVLTPMCHSAADAARVVRWSKYPPHGSRGYGPMYAIHSFPGVAAGDAYDVDAASSLVVAVQIESREGVDNVDAIAAVDGLDVLLIGPFDLALQMGVVRGGPAHEAAIQQVLRAAHAHGKRAAIFCSDGAQARQRLAEGFDMVSITTDVGAISEAMVQHLGLANGTAVERTKRDGY